MALSNVIKHQHDSGTIVLRDGTPTTPLSITARYDNSDFSLSGLIPGGKDNSKYVVRGKTVAVRHTTPVYPSGSFSVMVAEFSEATAGTLFDFLCRREPFEDAVSTGAGDVFQFDLVYTMEGTSYGDGNDHIVACENCHITGIDYSEGEPNSLSFAFEVLGDVKVNGTSAIVASVG